MSRIDVQDSSQTFVHHLSRLGSRLGALLVLLCTLLPAVTQAHDIPSLSLIHISEPTRPY